MTYPNNMKESLKKVEASRARRLKEAYPPLSMEEKKQVLKEFYPVNREGALRKLRIGPNKGEQALQEFADNFEKHSYINPDEMDLSQITYDVDVLIIGGGASGLAAALTAYDNGVVPMMVTKLRLGDSNSMMSQGGIQAAIDPKDSPAIHYLDGLGGGGFFNVPELLKALVNDGPGVIRWLEGLGVMFDKHPDGMIKSKAGGGTSRQRLHYCRDLSGAGITTVLRDEVLNRRIPVLDFTSAVELLSDEKGRCAGAVLMNMETNEISIARAKTVVLATGGSGRLHVQNFPTTNHYGATGDGLVMAYRLGAKFIYLDTVQYHPTGGAYPEQTVGLLVAETARSTGAQLVNSDGEQFLHPLETRDVTTSVIIRECRKNGKGITTPRGTEGVWLDTPMIDIIHGEGTLLDIMPNQFRRYMRYNIDPNKEPILITPVLHYQNGGILINDQAQTGVENLFAGGEVEGGVHGRNRLMGNSWLDIMVFGRRAGRSAALKSKEVKPGKISLEHTKKYNSELDSQGIKVEGVSPILLPNYNTEEVRKGLKAS